MCEWDGAVLNDFSFRKVFWSCGLGVCACVYGHLKPYVFLSSHIFFFYTKIQRLFFLSVMLQYFRQNIIYASLSLLCVGEEDDFGGARFEAAF